MDIFAAPPSWPILVLGPIAGSTLAVLAEHWPAHATFWRRSACATCHTVLRPAELIPLASFIAQRGRCRTCGAPIGWTPFLMECAALAIAIAAFIAATSPTQAYTTAALGWTLLLAAAIDSKTFRLPDSLTLPLILTGLANTALTTPHNLSNHAAATAIGYLAFTTLNAAYRALRHRDGLGAGDAKLLAAAGAWLGAAALPNIILTAGCIGLLAAASLSLAGRRLTATTRIPFGPALAIALFALRLTQTA